MESPMKRIRRFFKQVVVLCVSYLVIIHDDGCQFLCVVESKNVPSLSKLLHLNGSSSEVIKGGNLSMHYHGMNY